jgi:hypothetical protein
VAEFVSERTIALPFYNRLSENEISYLWEILRRAGMSLNRGSSFGADRQRARCMEEPETGAE